jgi:outer membrane protein TolC
VTQIPKLLPIMPSFTIDKDQYQAVAEVNQTVWDGGAIAAQKKNTRAAAEAELKKVETDMYAINDRVQQVFLGVLLLEEQLKHNEILQKELETNFNRVLAYRDNGVANQADVDAVKVEQLNAMQRRIELLSAQKAYRQTLSILIGEEIPDGAALVKPEETAILDLSKIARPELDMFDAQKAMLESQVAAVNAALRPKLSLFVQGGYGRPGLNMLKNDFSSFYIGGARLSWSLSGFYSFSNSTKKIRLEMDKVETQRDAFLLTVKCQVSQQASDVDKCRLLMKSDDDIIGLRTSIKNAAEAKVANGTMTVADLLREINAESFARQAKALHEIQLLMSLYSLKNS